jgi:hypothetical protein
MTENRPGRARRWTARILMIFAVLGLALSVPVLWLHDTVFTTDGYVAVVDQLPGDPEFSDAVGVAAAGRIVDRLNLGDRLKELLPDAIDPLITTLVIGLEDRLGQRLSALVADPRFTTAWIGANQTLHTQLLELLRGDPGVVGLQGQTVTLDLTALVAGALRALQEVGVVPADVALADNPDGSAAAAAIAALRARGWNIPDDLTAIPLFDAPNLGLAQNLVRYFDAIAFLLPVLAIAFGVIAVILNRRVPRSLVIYAASIAIGAAVTLIAVIATGDALERRARPVGAAMVDSLFAALAESLWRYTVATLFISALLVILAWIIDRRDDAKALERAAVPVPAVPPLPAASASQPAR